jgi:hypothetical protein
MTVRSTRTASIFAAVAALTACGPQGGQGAAKAAAPAAPAPAAAGALASGAALCDLIQAKFADFLPAGAPHKSSSTGDTCTVGGSPIGQPPTFLVRAMAARSNGANPGMLTMYRNGSKDAADAPEFGANAFSTTYAADNAMAKLGFTTVKGGHLVILEIQPGKPLAAIDQTKARADAKALLDAL